MQKIALPEPLVAQLRAYEARLRRIESVSAGASAAVGLLASFVVLFVLDRFSDTPRWARIALTVSGGALAVWCAHGWIRHWLIDRRGPAQLAKLLQRHFRSLGDRLQGIIELTESNDLPANISPSLLRAAVRQVAEESSRFQFTQAVPTRPARRWALTGLALAALALTPFLFVPKAASNALARWIHPWANIDRYTFASIDALPKELVVAHGEPFEIQFGLRSESAWKPAIASARLNRRDAETVPLHEGAATFRVEGQTQEGILSIQIGDAKRDVVIRPLHRPEMRALAAAVEFPDYLGYPKAAMAIQGSTAQFLEGSKVSFDGKVTRALGKAEMTSGDARQPAETRADQFLTKSTDVASLGADTTFRWTDQYGLTPSQPYTLHVSLAKDAEPRVELQGLEAETAILPNEVLKLNLAASDDYGLKGAWLGWSARTLGEKKQDLGKGEAAHFAGGQTKRELAETADFSPQWQHIPEDSIVELAAYAVDYLPQRKPVESWKYTIYVLSPAKHAERVRERMDQALKDLNERIRDEERQFEETKSLAEDKKSIESARAGEDIKRAEAGEQVNQAQMQKLTEQMRDILKDALRNKEIPAGTVADLQHLAEKLEQKATPPMQEATGALQKAGQPSAEREENLAKAQEEQQQALNAMREASKTMSTTNQNLYARNFYNRLRAAASSEHQVSDGLKSLARNTLGLKPEEIADGDKKEFSLVAERQDGTTKDVDKIATDLSDFIKRVPNEKYDAVEKEMQEKRVVPELSELSGFVRANLAMKSIGGARKWGEQLDAWATMLQSECKSQGSGSGEMDPDLMELIVAMVRTAQAEDNIRDETSLLDSKKANNPNHPEDAKKLAGVQDELYWSLDELRERTKFNDVKPALKAAEDLMREVSDTLEQPKTDQEVVSEEGAVIELLVPPDKKGGKGSSKMQQMMRQMMSQMTRSAKPGGNNSKSSSPFAAEEAEGAVARARADGHSVEKTGAANTADWPEEFRDELQAYFQATDSGGK